MDLEERIKNLSTEKEDIKSLFEYIDEVCHKEDIVDDSSSNRREIVKRRKEVRDLLETICDKDIRTNICFFYDHRIEYKENQNASFYDMLLVKCCSHIEFGNQYAMIINYLLGKIIYLTELQQYELLIHLLENESRQAIIPDFFTRHNMFWHAETDLMNRAISHTYHYTVEKRINRRHAQVIKYIMEQRDYKPIDRSQKEKIAEILEHMKNMEAWNK
jgi:hypothetical protein